MVKSLNWSETALKDLEKTVEYIYDDSPSYAAIFYSAVMEKAGSLKYFSQRGRVVPELEDTTIREVFIHRYRLIYKIFTEKIVILSFVHGAMDLNNYFKDRQ